MIRRIKLENFRSIQSLDLELRPLNVLIGRNGSGKSNFLSFFQILGDGVRESLNPAIINEVRGFGYLRHINSPISDSVVWEVEFSSDNDGNLFYQGEIGVSGAAGYTMKSEKLSRVYEKNSTASHKYLEVHNGIVRLLTDQNADKDDALLDNLDQELGIAQIRNQARYPALSEALNYIRSWEVFNGFGEQELKNIRSPQTLNVVQPLQLMPDGSNLVSLLWELANQPRYEVAYERLNEIMRSVFPEFKQFDLPIVAGAQASIAFRSATLKDSVPAFFMSDGQLRFLGLVVLLLLSDESDLILIDEPEIGMHPKMIDIFVELLKEASNSTQIIVSTHSPQLISAFKPQDLLIAENIDGNTRIDRPNLDKVNRWLDRYTMGELWTKTTMLEG